MKKTLAVILSMLMLVLMAVPAMAAEVCPTDGCGAALLYMTVAPNCTEDGYTSWKCAICGYEEKTDIVPALGHAYGAYEFVEGDCTHDSYDHAYCVVCGAEDKQNVVVADGHNFTSREYVGVTCTVAEHYLLTCADCGATEIEKVLGGQPYTGHDMKLISAPKTCADAAVEVRECTKCGFTSEKAVNAIACVDADADDTCDVCTNKMPVEEEPHGFYAQIIKWISEIIEAFKAFLAAIKGDSLF
ncbi:MAG: hypothetical protein E7523_10205 [Ruminococcaceae bacterium]|nr:hypothetical protein [Oscillospiraceae bacterium]